MTDPKAKIRELIEAGRLILPDRPPQLGGEQPTITRFGFLEELTGPKNTDHDAGRYTFTTTTLVRGRALMLGRGRLRVVAAERPEPLGPSRRRGSALRSPEQNERGGSAPEPGPPASD